MYENVKTVESGGFLSYVTGFLKGAVIGVLITFAVFLIFAFLLSYTPLPEESIRYIAYATEVVGAFASGLIPARKSGKRGILTGLLSGTLYMLIIWLFSSLAADGFYFDTHILTMLLLSAISGAVGGVVGVNTKSAETNKKKR